LQGAASLVKRWILSAWVMSEGEHRSTPYLGELVGHIVAAVFPPLLLDLSLVPLRSGRF
jgi:hypothetical protein